VNFTVSNLLLIRLSNQLAVGLLIRYFLDNSVATTAFQDFSFHTVNIHSSIVKWGFQLKPKNEGGVLSNLGHQTKERGQNGGSKSTKERGWGTIKLGSSNQRTMGAYQRTRVGYYQTWVISKPKIEVRKLKVFCSCEPRVGYYSIKNRTLYLLK
jgi:hypothetical protein